MLDLAALDRQDVEPQDPVQLELDGVRLKTGLKLLLDQLGLTYRIVAEDNLMIITDVEGSEDPNGRIASELRALHRDLHELQDAVDELRDYLGDERGRRAAGAQADHHRRDAGERRGKTGEASRRSRGTPGKSPTEREHPRRARA